MRTIRRVARPVNSLHAAGLILMAVLSAYACRASDAAIERYFDIPAQPLAEALLQFAEQSGNMIVAPTALTAGKSSPALKGRMSAASALRVILNGFPLRYSWRDETTIVILSANDGALGPAVAPGPKAPARLLGAGANRQSAQRASIGRHHGHRLAHCGPQFDEGDAGYGHRRTGNRLATVQRGGGADEFPAGSGPGHGFRRQRSNLRSIDAQLARPR